MAIDWSAVKVVKIPEGDCKRVAINGTIVWEKGGLPSEYQQVEYIESTGTQYIDTGVIGKTGLHIVAEMGYTTIAQSNAFFGGRRSQNRERFFVTVWPLPLFDIGYGDDIRTNIVAQKGKIYSIDFDASTSPARFGIDGVYVESGAQVDTHSNIYIFAISQYLSTVIQLSKSIFKSMTIADENGELLRNFVPCYRKSDGEIGMYDLVNGVFYTNSGSGTFTKGEDV